MLRKLLIASGILLLALLVLLPKIMSTPLGKPFFTRQLESKTYGKITIGSLNLSWFGPQTFKDVHWTRGGAVGTLEEFTIDAPFWSFSGPFHLKNGSIVYKGGTIDQIEGEIKKPAGAPHDVSSLGWDFEIKGGTLQGNISLKGQFESQLHFNIHIDIQKFPVIVIDQRLDEILGPTLDLAGTITQDTVDLTLSCPNLKTVWKGNLTPHAITLREPLQAQIRLTPELSALILKEANPFLITGFAAKNQVSLTLSRLSLPLPYSFEKLSAEGVLDLGQVECQNGKALAALISLLNIPEPAQMTGWFTPIAFRLSHGVIETDRMDALFADTIHICTWGKIDLMKDQVRMFLGLAADTLGRYFGLKHLDENFVLKIPIRGTTQDPQIDKKKALAQIAKALFFKPEDVPPRKTAVPLEGMMRRRNTTLEEIAHEAMIARGFIPDFSADIVQQLETVNEPAPPHDTYRDLRHLLWISIDNEDSEDLDQLTYAEEGKIFVAIADVDALVKKRSPIDNRAAHNTTSVYTPTKIFPMLPLKLSTNLTSLNENRDRCAIVIEMDIAQDGRFQLNEIYPALVHNQAKLNYSCVGAWLEEIVCKKPFPAVAGLREQLKLQDELAHKILEYRNRQGALEFGEIKLQPIVVGGRAVDLKEEERNRAHRLIENYMIAANVGATRFLKERHFPTLRRVVKTPKRWNRIVRLAKDLGTTLPSQPDPKALRQFLLHQQKTAPLAFPDLSLAIIKLLGRGEYVISLPGQPSPGHFDLAEHEYTHATAPNRRFPDLLMQRLLKAALFKEKAIYNQEELFALAVHCTQKEDDANKIERRLVKCAAAMVMEKELGQTFKAMVTGADSKGTWVRLQGAPPVEGKLIKGFEGVDVGESIHVKLIHVDIFNGHIDFAREP